MGSILFRAVPRITPAPYPCRAIVNLATQESSGMDLSTDYLGLHLVNPIVISASPLQRDLDNIRRMEDAGAAAVVLLGAAPIAVASLERGADPIVSLAVDGPPVAIDVVAPAFTFGAGLRLR